MSAQIGNVGFLQLNQSLLITDLLREISLFNFLILKTKRSIN